MELFKLFGTIAINNSEANKGIDETTNKAENAHPKIAAAFSKIGSAAVVAGKAIATGLAAGATAMGKLVSDSISGFAEYEQLVGGVETLFKENGNAVIAYAENAYKTAGLSANEYMETVTSFAATLNQSLTRLDGDIARSADMANLAITDMSDNANKMGTSMSMIQNAYQGFAKQNYSMLDNLKLGYGGTQQEMFRLLGDAKMLDSTFDAVFSIDEKGHLEAEFADIVEAIHIIQTNMGITGTTAKEASSTIQGSIATMRSAWKNFVAGMADESQDFDALLNNLVESFVTVASNLIPRIQQLLPRLVEGLNTLIDRIVPLLSPMIESLLPGIIDGALALMTGLIVMLPDILSILIDQLPEIFTQIGAALVTCFPLLYDVVVQLFRQIWDYIAVSLLGTENDFDSTMTRIGEFFSGLWAECQLVWENIGQPIFDYISSAISVVRDSFAERMPEIQAFVSSVFSDIQDMWTNHLQPCFKAIGDFITNHLKPAFEKTFKNSIMPIVDTCFQFIKGMWEGTLKPVFTGIIDFITGVFSGDFDKAFKGIANIAIGAFNGIISGVEFCINYVIDAINRLIDAANEVADLVPGLGKMINIPNIGNVSFGRIPMLAEGGILEKGQVGLLEGNGAEAVVPLDQNRAWVSAVAEDMNAAMGSSKQVQELKEAFQAFVNELPEMMVDAFASMKFDVNNREFARLVKAVN